MLENGLGLEIAFAQTTDITHVLGDRTIRNPDMCDLVHEFGFVVARNAHMRFIPNLGLTGGSAQNGTILMQDPFHIDPVEGITALTMGMSGPRHAPTFYADERAVRDAYRTMALKLPPDTLLNVREAVTYMAEENDAFVIQRNGWKTPRRIIQDGLPFATELLARAIAPSRIHKHCWNTKNPSIVFHSNRPNCIAHARPHSRRDMINPLTGCVISA